MRYRRMKVYSEDLRKKIVAAIEGGMPKLKLLASSM
jgi:hypothetical protein